MKRLPTNRKHMGIYKAPEECSRDGEAVLPTESHNNWSWNKKRSKDKLAKIDQSGEATNY
jgi:hypothetical protein